MAAYLLEWVGWNRTSAGIVVTHIGQGGHMKKLLIIAMGLFLVSAPSALAYDVTSDPDAAITQEQKLGPNAHARRAGNKIIIQKGASYRRYAHHRYRH